MTSCVSIFVILFCLHFVSYPCTGTIFLPPRGGTIIAEAGSDVEIAWTFDTERKPVKFRYWRFMPANADILATIFNDGFVEIRNTTFRGVEVEMPATLILKNIDLRYNGTYRFILATPPCNSERCKEDTSDVAVFVAVKPTVATNCSSPVIVIEGDCIECLCKEKGGNPPANLAWYKDGVQIGDTGYKKSRLTLKNIGKNASGTYKCVAQNHILKDEKSIEVFVFFPPAVTSLTAIPERAVLGKLVVIVCNVIAVPIPRYIVIHNDTVVSTDKTYIIPILDYSHTGSYKCFATNRLGNSSKTYNLSVLDSDKATYNKSSCGTEWYILLILLVPGVIIAICRSCIEKYSRRQLRNREPQLNPEAETSKEDTTYQDLDLKKMNSGDGDYQSLSWSSAGGEGAYENDYILTARELNNVRDD